MSNYKKEDILQMSTQTKKKLTTYEAGLKHGFRSGLEERFMFMLAQKGINYQYEMHKIKFVQPAQNRTYTPDFFLYGNAGKVMIIETKGRFVPDDRKKMALIKEQYPELDIRIVFSNAHAKISKTSKTTYAMWCDKQNIPWSTKGLLPDSWLQELNKND